MRRPVAVTLAAALLLGLILSGGEPAAASERCDDAVVDEGPGMNLLACIYLDAHNARATTTLAYFGGSTGIILGSGAAIYARVNRSGRSLTNTCPVPGFIEPNKSGVVVCNAYIPNTAAWEAFSATGWSSWRSGDKSQSPIIAG